MAGGFRESKVELSGHYEIHVVKICLSKVCTVLPITVLEYYRAVQVRYCTVPELKKDTTVPVTPFLT